MESRERSLYGTLIAIIGFCLVFGIVSGGPGAIGEAIRLQTVPARLIQDYTGGVGGDQSYSGGALINAAAVALLALVLVRINRIRLSGPTIAAVFTILGFGLFGKTVLNAVPILVGVYLAARFAGKTFGEYILIGLFGTALGPIVTTIAFEIAGGVWTIPLAALGGVATGFLLPPAAIAMLKMHQGYSLYNIGLTSGFLGIFAAALLRATGSPLAGVAGWIAKPDPVLRPILPTISVFLLAVGVAFARKNVIADFRKIGRIPGRLPSDFLDLASTGGSLVNMGVMGLLFWGYTVAIGAPQNGPVIGAVLTVIGFSAFGKHPGNCWAPVAGVVAATLLFGRGLAEPGPLLAVYFVTTLAPLSGTFGPLTGVIAGMIHLTLVLQTGGWHGGLALYNNGFAGGLTAALVIAVIEWYRSTHDETLRRWRKEER